MQSANWIWVPVIIAFSALTYLASAISLLGSVAAPAAVLAHGADPGRLLVRQPGVLRATSAAWP